MTFVVEMLNPTEEHSGYFLNTVRDALTLIDRVGSKRLRLLFDIYHVQLGEGNIIRKLREHTGYIGQIDFADAPGRHEPGTGENQLQRTCLKPPTISATGIPATRRRSTTRRTPRS